METNRQYRNTLHSITVGEVVFEEPNQVRNEVWTHFSNHFKEDWVNRPVLAGEFKSIRLSDSFHMLEGEFTEEEVWAPIKDCNGNKAPGPDGFNLMFFQKQWKVIKD